MKTQKNKKHILRLGTILLLCLAACLTAFAQTRPVQEKTGKKDNTEAAWKLQAQSVSEEAGLDKAQTAKVVEAYIAGKKSHKQALKELPEEKDKDKSRTATQAAIEKDRAKFVASLKGIIPEELMAKILPTLGSFNAKWDGYVVALQDLKLEKGMLKSAMKLMIEYVTDSEAANAEMMKTYHRKANSRPFKEKLDTGLAGLLSADQMNAWKEATAASDSKNKSSKSDTTTKGDRTKKGEKSKNK